jgi:uncharacterized protein YciI
MKRLILLSFFMAICVSQYAQLAQKEYDSTLAKSYGADEYGMKHYVLVMLIPGTNNLEKGAERDSLFRGHMKNIGRLAESGQLVLAGPFEDNVRSYRGLFILNVKSIADAKDLLQSDPVIKSKVLDAELYEWYGTAALGEYLKLQKSITKKPH